MKQFHVYIMASRRNGTLYIGVTSELVARVWQHRTKAVPGFTVRYGCDRLVYFEAVDSAEAAITREKRMKEWRRAWKIALIEKTIPNGATSMKTSWRDVPPHAGTNLLQPPTGFRLSPE